MIKFSSRSHKRTHVDLPPQPKTRDEIIEGVKITLQFGLYEDSDFEIAQDLMRVDLAYDSKGTVDSYQGRLREKYPGQVETEGTLTTIYFKMK